MLIKTFYNFIGPRTGAHFKLNHDRSPAVVWATHHKIV
jgi:hypothetical protein